MDTLRCAICDKTNNLNVANHGGVTRGGKRSFITDPKNSEDIICMECNEEVNDALSDFRDDDK